MTAPDVHVHRERRTSNRETLRVFCRWGHEAELVDLSAGCYVAALIAPDEGQEIELTTILDGVEATVAGMVRRPRMGVGFALAFTTLSDTTRTVIERAVEKAARHRADRTHGG